MGKLDGFRVAVLFTDGVEQVELTEPTEAFEKAGADVDWIAPKEGKIQGMQHDDKGDLFTLKKTLETASPGDYDGVYLPGGALNADHLRMNERARDFVREFEEKGKPIAAICHGPWLLVSAGLVKNKRLTSYFTVQDDIRNGGGEWVDQEAVRDGNWVTSRQPKDIPAFNDEAIALFAEYKETTAAQAAAEERPEA